jgi:hypothetical protein
MHRIQTKCYSTLEPCCLSLRRLCNAWTVWKVQGQTLKGKVIASLLEHGLTYTVFSRVTKASPDLGIIGGFPKQYRLITDKVLAKKSKMVPRRQKEERRLHGIVTQVKKKFRNLEVNTSNKITMI